MNEDKYTYKTAIKTDIICYINENGIDILTANLDELDIILFDNDSITGNAYGSYTFSRWKAESYLCHNYDIIEEMVDKGFISLKDQCDPETLDVCIRCYLLRECLEEIKDEVKTSLNK